MRKNAQKGNNQQKSNTAFPISKKEKKINQNARRDHSTIKEEINK